MASILNADDGVVSGSAGLKSTADSSGVLALQTNGTTAVTVTAAGSVGIGTTTPADALNISTGKKFRATHSASVYQQIFSSASGNFLNAYGDNFQVSADSGAIYLTTVAAQPIVFQTTNTDRLAILSGGNVGIGTSAPNRLLSLYATQPVFQITNVASGNTQGTIQYQTSGGTDFILDNQGSGTGGNIIFQQAGSERMRISSAGNVGIGTTSPSNKLTVLAGTGLPSNSLQEQAALVIGETASGRIIGVGTFASGTWIQSSYPGVAGPAYPLILNPSGGAIGIGNSAPVGNLHIGNGSTVGDQDLYLQSDSSNRPRLRLWGGTANKLEISVGGTADINVVSGAALVFSTSNTERARINSDGGLLVGSTSTSGSVGNYGLVLGGVFRSFAGQTASTASGTYVTLFTASSGTISSYLVTVWISADDVNNYQANVIVNTQAGSSTKVSVIVAGSLLQFQMSGYDFQARQNSGGASTISWSAIRILA